VLAQGEVWQDVRIGCVGGGPAGLYFAILMKLRDMRHDVTVVERNPAGVTYGWGVVFWDGLLDNLYRCDPTSAKEIRDSATRWHDQEVHIRGARVHLGGYGFSMGRKRLLDILVQRATDLGVDVQFQRTFTDLSEFAAADLIVACDGVNSQIRRRDASHFRTHVGVGRNKYIWLGTPRRSTPSRSPSKRRLPAGSGSMATGSIPGPAPASWSARRRPGMGWASAC
jgi:anthraniloyl-CoA monooxygenase